MTAESSTSLDDSTSLLNTLVPTIVGLVLFVVNFDITAIVMVMPLVKQDLALDVGGFAWLMDSYSIALTAFLLSAGILADRFGRRMMLLGGDAIFLLASLQCAFAGAQTSLIIGRVGQGIGAAFMMSSGLAIIGNRYTNTASRARAFAWTGTMAGVATALGPAGGGLIADLLGWHWVFLINIPICLFIAIAAIIVVDESRDPAKRKIDLRGIATLSALLLSVVWLLLHGARISTFEIPSWLAILWVLALFIAFWSTQRFGTQPLIELDMFSSRTFVGFCLVPVALSVAYWAVLIYLPLFLQERLGRSFSDAWVLMLAATMPMVALPMFSARIALAMEARVFFGAGLLIVSIGAFVMAAAAQMQHLVMGLIGMAIAGCANGALNPQLTARIVGSVRREQAGAASAISVILRQGGFAIGIAMFGAVMRTSLEQPSLILTGINVFATIFAIAAIAAVVGSAAVFTLIGLHSSDRELPSPAAVSIMDDDSERKARSE
ncbi:MFS transporter [Bradyrhizobium sp. HKCCYLRH2015]|uniref:MFS transporter n=1 Tax=Bradyrhizobium sp. HKCCYLRH2015 TaxID=3420742 RepID=UPI003EB9D9E1